jgi:hypothetical protein
MIAPLLYYSSKPPSIFVPEKKGLIPEIPAPSLQLKWQLHLW